ncbi:DUF2326 domain-containing protein [Streptomyces sp. NPDC097727]|uniref:DUF2326 domain-containing protein n=1 Tax=Streptomyces sp. NPDC097727 TaxID=3366092 RepID=UPI003811B936
MAHRHGRVPDFLIHDGHSYDGAGDRQFAAALNIAAEVTEEKNLLYILTINTASPGMASRVGFDREPYIRNPRPTGEHETGGHFFGFRSKTIDTRQTFVAQPGGAL